MKARISTLIILLVATLSLAAQDDANASRWLHLFRKVGSKTRVLSVEESDLKQVLHRGNTATGEIFNVLVTDQAGNVNVYDMNDVTKAKIGVEVPTIYITTDDASLTEVKSKTDYVSATVSLKGYSRYPDLSETKMQIRGRGNSTWSYAKKPYRMKFEKKLSICGMKKAKNYVFIANYIDNTLLRNPFALKAAQLLGMPYTNTAIPVEIYFNGIYKGAYMMTEKVGINGASVDIDENEGIMFELDTYYDEDPKFRSQVFNLPVMVKDPDFSELAAEAGATMTAAEMLAKWQADFQDFENTLGSGSVRDFADYIDIESLVDYFIVYNLARNMEPYHPKSVYMYKEKQGEKYKMGPVWDFDWAYTYNGGGGTVPPTGLLFSNSGIGTNFFKAMLSDARVLALFGQKWKAFKEEKLPLLWQYFDEYADLIESSAARDGEKWENTDSTNTFPENVEALRTWLQKRIAFIDSHKNYGLF